VHVVSRKRILEFAAKHPDSRSALLAWFKIMSTTNYRNFADLRRTFASADQVSDLTVFNISGNKYRLIAAIHYNRQKVYIRNILKHADYDRGLWRN
jgi:mRNA interferase HigB